MSFNIGENVGPYRVIEQLGQGGMATVYKAYHASLDRYVALKVLHPAFHQDQTFITRFQREARVIARLEHPHIVPIYDYSEHESRPFLVMKYIEGDTLKARLNQGPLTSKEIEHVVNSVGSALAYAHKQGILHRDIKPSNVMIAKDGAIYLADFGLARIAEAGESTISSDSIMGTPQYISPEQAMGKKDLDAGTDIYSFGVMLYEMVVGQVPFNADTPFSIIHDHIYTPLPLPNRVNPKVPESVQRVLLKALAKDRLDRYTSTEELMTAFKEAWTEAGVPMQGTVIIMSPTISKDKTGSIKPSATSNDKTAAAKIPVKKVSPWLWISMAVIILLCLTILGLAIRSRLMIPTPSPSAATQMPPVSPLPPPEKSEPVETPPLPEIKIAQELAVKNPNDPDAHLTLSLALWDSKEVRPAMEQLLKAFNLAGPDNKDFLFRAAEKFVQREAWIPAASIYLRLTLLHKQEMPKELTNNFHEAVYKSAEQKDAPLFISFDRIENIDPPLGYIARARHALGQGNIEEAKMQAEAAEKIKPGMYEALMLKAEIAIKTKNQEDAKKIMLSLTSDPEVPEWLRIMAENNLKTIQ